MKVEFILVLFYCLALENTFAANLTPTQHEVRASKKRSKPAYAHKKEPLFKPDPYLGHRPLTDPAHKPLQPHPSKWKDPAGESERMIEQQREKLPLPNSLRPGNASTPFSN